MKAVLCLFLIGLKYRVSIQSQDLYELSPLDLIELLRETVEIRDGDVKETDVTFYLSTRSNMESPEPELISKERNDQIDISKNTKIIIHGWIENHRVRWYADMKDELLKYEDVNVIYVDWERVSKSFYFSSAKNTMLIGSIVGRFIVDKKLPPEKLHLIGHSLGAHVAGFACKYIKRATGNQVRRVTALDPAGPYFRVTTTEGDGRLNAGDADIVDVIHTDGKFLGLYSPIGTLDIYVNGGVRRQPGCRDGEFTMNIYEVLKNLFCSHTRSYSYFTQSINNAHVICKKCHAIENLINDDCSETDTYRIMHQNVTETMKGICAVSTDSTPPYFVN